MKNIIYAFLFLTLPISMAGKDTTTIKADSPAATKAAKQEEIKTPPAPSIVKHDTVYVAVKEMPEDNSSWWVSIATVFLTFTAIGTTIWSARKSFKFSSDTLKEMKEQRLAAYRPSLHFIPLQILFERKNSEITYSYDMNGTVIENKDVIIAFNNIGMGAAKDIETKWTFDNSSILGAIERLVDKND